MQVHTPTNDYFSIRSTYHPPGTRPPPSYPPSFDPPAVIYHTQEFFPTPSPTAADATTPYFTENISPQPSSLSTAPLPVPGAPSYSYQGNPPGGHLYVDQHVSHGNFGRDQTRPLTVYDPNVLRRLVKAQYIYPYTAMHASVVYLSVVSVAMGTKECCVRGRCHNHPEVLLGMPTSPATRGETS